MDILDLINTATESSDAAEVKKKKKKKSPKQLKKLLVKQQEEARLHLLMSRQKYLEETKERVQNEWEINKAKKLVFLEEQEDRIRHFRTTYERLSEIEDKWSELKREKAEAEEWERYMKCNKLPDPTVLPQVNTYKFVWTEIEKGSSIAYSLKKTEEVMQLLRGLDHVISDPWPDCPPNLLSGWKCVRNDMRDLLQDQLDKATYKLFRRIENEMQPVDVVTSQYYCEDTYFAMHLWAELITPIPSSRATEVRHAVTVPFKPANLTVVLPVILLDVHKVIRVIQTYYDHWSDRCRSYDTPAPPAYLSKDLLQLATEELDIRSEIVHHREQLEVVTRKRIGNIPPQPTLSQELLAWDGEPQRVLSEEVAFREGEDEEAWKTQVKMKLNEHEVNLRERMFLGGAITLEILHQPPQPKYLRYKHDVTVLMEPPTLQPVDFHVEFPPPRPEAPPEDEEEYEERVKLLEEEYGDLVEKERKKLIRVTLELPKTVCWFEQPEVAWWDVEEGYWSSENIHEVSYDEEEQVMTFKMGAIGLFGLHVSRFCNLPYTDWLMEGDGAGGVDFYLKTSRVGIRFKIQEDKVCVTEVEDSPVKPMGDLLNTFHAPLKIVQMLKSFGIDVFPELDAGCYVTDMTPKHVVCERFVYQVWGLFSSSLCFKFSKFNRDRGRRTAVFQVREVWETYQTNFCLVRVSPDEACVLDVTEEDAAYSPEPAPYSKVIADLYNLFMRNCTNTAKRKADATSFVLIQTVREFLSYIRPLSFS